MKKLFYMLVASLCCNQFGHAQPQSAIDPYVTFINDHHESAKDYVLSLFETHDLVIICERTHPELTQYSLFSDIIADKRFIENVGNIFVEIGNSRLNPALNNFLHTRNLPGRTADSLITGFQRNASMWPVWSPKNYGVFYKNIYNLNNRLPADKQMNVYPSDIPFIWTAANEDSMPGLKAMLAVRDSIIAQQVIRQFDITRSSGAKRKKALVIMNYRHAFNQEFLLPGSGVLHNVAYYLFKQYGNNAANVFLNTVSYGKDDNMDLVQQGKWDAAFKKTGRETAGFNFENSPFGKDSFDIWPIHNSFCYRDVFTGFIFYLPVEKHLLVDGAAGLVDTVFKKELRRRIHLMSQVGGEFSAKMKNYERLIDGDHPVLNMEEKKKYYQADSLIIKRNNWLK